MKSIFRNIYIWAILAAAILSSCADFEKEVDLELPPFQSQLVVESYIEDGKMIKVAIMESQDYFGELKWPFLDSSAIDYVAYSLNGKSDTLRFMPFFPSLEDLKYFNYFALDSFRFKPGDVINIYVKDKKGRMATAESRWMDAVKIDSIQHFFRTSDSNAYILTHFTDPGGVKNNYRFRIRNLSDSAKVYQDFFTNDNNVDGIPTAFGTNFRFKKNDTVEISLYTLTDEYYDFLNTANAAANANGNPFAQPAVIKSNIKGGTGIFTFLPFDRKKHIIK